MKVASWTAVKSTCLAKILLGLWQSRNFVLLLACQVTDRESTGMPS